MSKKTVLVIEETTRTRYFITLDKQYASGELAFLDNSDNNIADDYVVDLKEAGIKVDDYTGGDSMDPDERDAEIIDTYTTEVSDD